MDQLDRQDISHWRQCFEAVRPLENKLDQAWTTWTAACRAALLPLQTDLSPRWIWRAMDCMTAQYGTNVK